MSRTPPRLLSDAVDLDTAHRAILKIAKRGGYFNPVGAMTKPFDRLVSWRLIEVSWDDALNSNRLSLTKRGEAELEQMLAVPGERPDASRQVIAVDETASLRKSEYEREALF